MRPYQKWTLFVLLLANLLVFVSLGAAIVNTDDPKTFVSIVTATPNRLLAGTNLPVTPAANASTPVTGTPALDSGLNTIQLAPQRPIPGSDLAAIRFPLGQSVEGRTINSFTFPAIDAGAALVLVCGIHGDEVNAWPVLQSLIADFYSRAISQPSNLSLYFIESLNPDGTIHNDRLNANGVDLNRNWDTTDWRTRVEVGSSEFLPRGGGPEPFSEPETQIMRDFLLDLQANHPGGVTVVYFHAAFPPRGMVLPGAHHVNGEDRADTASRELGLLLAEAIDFSYSNLWTGNYTVTGDATTWAVAQGMKALTVELPARTALEPEAALRLRDGILMMIEVVAAGQP